MKRPFRRAYRLPLIPGLLAASAVLAAEPASEEQAVLAAVEKFFETMAAQDPVGAAEVVMPEGTFFSVREVDGAPRVRSSTNQEYLESMPLRTVRVLERVWNPEVRVHGRIATVWTRYDFYRDGEISHCGTDAFDLVKTEDGWKITGGVYTVEPGPCADNPLGPPGAPIPSRRPPTPDDPRATRDDHRFILRAYELARAAAAKGNHPFGALLVRDGEVVVEYENDVVTSGDLTRHAELGLVGRASARLGADALADCTLYTSTEPCVMCAGAIYWGGIGRLVYGVSEAQMDARIDSASRGRRIPSRELFRRTQSDIDIVGPVLSEQGLAIHTRFWPELRRKQED